MTDELIDEMLHKTHMDAFPDNVLKKRTKNMIMAKNEERKMQMRKLGIKKSIILATACCLLFGTVVIAAVPKKATVQHITAGEFTSYSDIAIAEKKAGIDIKSPESFSNGYEFKWASIIYSEDLDENKESIRKYEGISIEYAKNEAEQIALDAQPAQFFDMIHLERAQKKTSIDGIEVRYYSHSYKCVPLDYELTEEDIRRQKEEGLQITYGTTEIYERQTCNCTWIQDGIGYEMLCISSVIPADTMFEMAEEIITAK